MISSSTFLPHLVCACVSRPEFHVCESFAGVKTIAVGVKHRTGPGLVVGTKLYIF